MCDWEQLIGGDLDHDEDTGIFDGIFTVAG